MSVQTIIASFNMTPLNIEGSMMKKNNNKRMYKGKNIQCLSCKKDLFVRINQKHTGYCRSCFAKKLHEKYNLPISEKELYVIHGKLKLRAKKIFCTFCNKELLIPKGRKHNNLCHDCNSSNNGRLSYKNGLGVYRNKALNKFNNTCICCNEKDLNKLIVHHIDNNRNNQEDKNLMILCKSCHVMLHNRIKKGISYKTALKQIQTEKSRR